MYFRLYQSLYLFIDSENKDDATKKENENDVPPPTPTQ